MASPSRMASTTSEIIQSMTPAASSASSFQPVASRWYDGASHSTSRAAAARVRCSGVQPSVAASTASTSAARRRSSTARRVPSSTSAHAGAWKVDIEAKTVAPIFDTSSRVSPSYSTPDSWLSRCITASCRACSVAKCRYTVRSPTPARSATARNVSGRQSHDSNSWTRS